MTQRTCEATTKAGTPCQQKVADHERLCIWHDPARAEEATAARRRGGRLLQDGVKERRQERRLKIAEGSAGPRPKVGNSLPEIARWLRWVLEAGAAGELEKGEIVALTAGARVLQQVYEKRDLEKRLRQLQRQYDELKRGTTGRTR